MRRNKFNPRRKFERLEDRRMMAADIDFDSDSGVVTVEGTSDRDFIIVQTNPDDSDEIKVTIRNIETNEVLEDRTIERDDVTKVVAYGYGDDDYLQNLTNVRAEFYGGSGNDGLQGGSGNDLLDGGENDDNLEGGQGDDTLIGGSGNDSYSFDGAQLGADEVRENANADVDTLFFNIVGGINVNLAASVQQVVNSTHLRLTLSSNTGIENVSGTEYVDRIYGNSRDNELAGYGSGDYLWGREGADVLYGFSGNDYLYGEGGDDELHGGNDKDYLYGGANNDELFGENGDDKLYGEAGLDTLDGGANNDFLDGGYDGLNDILFGRAGKDTFVGHKRRGTTAYPPEQSFMDYDSAIDVLMTAWH
jgi:Ca2+-binding RTX toxin-like protein